ncbi:MAG: DUF4124 domain-containing protein [Deltaproteobacteria bacterium]|nr:DUF4124 domain-containing protein [Deltaproteobacteria bacterium]
MNKIKLNNWLILLVITGLPALASAEFYKYLDKNGNVRFTDNLANVPADQRSKVDEYENPPYPSSQEKKTEVEADEKLDREKSDQPAQAGRPPKEPLIERMKSNAAAQKLKETGARLREEYEALMKEREQLDKISTIRMTPAARKELVEKITHFNARIRDYDKRKEAYNKETQAHNASIKDARRTLLPEEQPTD